MVLFVLIEWFVDVPALPSSVNGIMVKYILKNVKSSWGYTSYGYVIIGPREKKPLQVVKKHNIVSIVSITNDHIRITIQIIYDILLKFFIDIQSRARTWCNCSTEKETIDESW